MSIEPELTIDFTEVLDTLSEVERKDLRFVGSTLDALINRLYNLIMEKIPFSSGDYAKSWQIRNTGPESREIFTLDEDLFIILEFRGAKPHDIVAGIKTGKSKKKALHYTDQNGIEHFYVKVHHKGFANKPHVRPAIAQFKREMRIIVLASAGVNYPKLLGGVTRSEQQTFSQQMGSILTDQLRVKRRQATKK